MKTIILTAGIMLLCFGSLERSEAQWPLGKEMSQIPLKTEHGPNLTATGRFQIFVSPHIKGHTFMLDTDTGKIWDIGKDSSSGSITAKRIAVEDVDGKQAEKTGSGETPKGAGGQSNTGGRKGP